MSVRKWHVGKLIILWVWGGLCAALALTDFLGRPVQAAPVAHLLEILFTLLVLLALSAITWHWLGGKESKLE
jgi:hypothetical protein